MVLAGIIDRRRGQVHRGAVVQILIEEGQHHLLAELRGGVAIPRERAEAPALAVDLAVPPRPHDEVVVAHMARRFERFPTSDRAVHSLLIPRSDEHTSDLQSLKSLSYAVS